MLPKDGYKGVEWRDSGGERLWKNPTENCMDKLAKELIEIVVDVNAQENEGWTALMVAPIEGHTEVVKLDEFLFKIC